MQPQVAEDVGPANKRSIKRDRGCMPKFLQKMLKQVFHKRVQKHQKRVHESTTSTTKKSARRTQSSCASFFAVVLIEL